MYKPSKRLITVIAFLWVFAAPASATLVIEDFETDFDLDQIFGESPNGPVYSTRVNPFDLGLNNVPGSSAMNSVMAADLPTSTYAGVGHTFAAEQNWSDYSLVNFWLYGTGNGNELTFNLVDRDTSTLTSEVWVSQFVDDFTGWRLMQFSFADFNLASFSTVGNSELDTTNIREWSFYAETRIGNGVVATRYLLDDIVLVPETGTLSLIFAGLFAMGLKRRKAR